MFQGDQIQLFFLKGTKCFIQFLQLSHLRPIIETLATTVNPSRVLTSAFSGFLLSVYNFFKEPKF